MKKKLLIFMMAVVISVTFFAEESEKDPYLWLENITGENALQWVKKQNQQTVNILEKASGFQDRYKKILEVMNSKKRIPYAVKRGKYLYNFWQDGIHKRGIYRRTTLDEYKKTNPKWEIILDIDALAKKEGENWVYRGMTPRYPDYERCLVRLSRGGADAVVIREFDIPSKSFLKNGFRLPEAKSLISWKDKNTVYVGTDFGKGSLTKSGYPRLVKLWKRNTSLSQAKIVFQTDKEALFGYGARFFSKHGHIDFIINYRTFYQRDYYCISRKKLIKLNIPEDADLVGIYKKQLIFQLKSHWKVDNQSYQQGTVIVSTIADLLNQKNRFYTLIKPQDRISISSVQTTKSKILVTVLDNVVSRLFEYTQDDGANWHQKEIHIGTNGTIDMFSTSEESDDYFITYTNFLTPTTLYMVTEKNTQTLKLKNLPHFFNASPFTVKQWEAVSRDGTRIPYFIVMGKHMIKNSSNPTLLNAYGGFEVSMRPSYNASIGINWLSKGGVYVLANIRGGGEFGPAWHQAALKKNRKKSFEDFIAVAEDLIRRKITSPEKLGIMGGSNGGLLVGTTFIMRPDLFNAVVCRVPLMDMKRYHKLLAGASWVAEYGNPDNPDMWDYLKTYSPYHNIKKGIKYPQVLITTSTRDDRVHPGHSRKMVAKMLDQGHPVHYYENIEGGHSGAANNEQRAYMSALSFIFLSRQLMPDSG
jgi:prolyl oligopeptidase